MALDPDELRRLLWETASRGDEAGLERLSRQHRATIVQHFPAWRKVPDEVRTDPARLEGYIQAMAAVGRLFAQRLGDPSLLQSLTGDPATNPLARWQQELEKAQKEMEELHYAETASRLADLLIDVRGLKGSGVDAYLPVTYGLLGECYFQTGQADKAVAPTEQAQALCRRSGDSEGTVTYLGNLYEIHRYRGAAAAAAETATELADCLEQQGQADEAARYRRQAELVRHGEPLCRVIVNLDGRRLELDDLLHGKPGRVQFAYERNRLTLRPCSAWTTQGEKLAGQGRFEGALQLFEQASAADRYDPQCRYQAGLTLLYLQRYAEAVTAYEETEDRAAGWFHCRSNLWLARQMLAGKVSHEVFQMWHVLQDGPLNPQQKATLAEKALRQAPDLALLHQLYGKSLLALGQRPAAEKVLRRGLDCAEEPDIKTRILVDLAAVVADAGEKRRLLEEAVALNGNLVAAAMARVVLALD
jgi:tetratricopeptide (TPR) repeat protein